jgi:hypothetical protein
MHYYWCTHLLFHHESCIDMRSATAVHVGKVFLFLRNLLHEGRTTAELWISNSFFPWGQLQELAVARLALHLLLHCARTGAS